jgi:hypothetical protein
MDGSAYPGHISIAAQSPGLKLKSRVTERFACGSSSSLHSYHSGLCHGLPEETQHVRVELESSKSCHFWSVHPFQGKNAKI